MVVGMVQNSKFQNFIHIEHLFIHIQHLCVFRINIHSRSTFIFMQNSTPVFIFNSYICSQNYYPFRNFHPFNNFLFIQDLLGISPMHDSPMHGGGTSCSQLTGGSEEAQVINGSLKRY